MTHLNPKDVLLADRGPVPRKAISTDSRRLLVVAGAGSGKTDVMARKIAWWVSVEGVAKESIVAFTFTEKAAEEMKFRIRKYIQDVTPKDEDATLGGMYVGTIHGYCINLLRQLRPDDFHHYDVVDDNARTALVIKMFYPLGLKGYQDASGKAYFAAIDSFLQAYDLLNEYNLLNVDLPGPAPDDLRREQEWIKQATMKTKVGSSTAAAAFEICAARYYAYLHARRFLDFSTSQAEAVRLLTIDADALASVREAVSHIVVDEVQDVNPVQDQLIRLLVGPKGALTAVGDHRQAIFGWRGGRVSLMARLAGELKKAPDGEVIELIANFRSTPRIIDVSNAWAKTITVHKDMPSPDMNHGRDGRRDRDPSHVAVLHFDERADEAKWIANTVKKLVPGKGKGAAHDTDEDDRGISYSDVVVLVRSSTDARTYMKALTDRGIFPVFRAGPDLFSQPEVMLFVACLAQAAGIKEFYGQQGNSLPKRIERVLNVDPKPDKVIEAACKKLEAEGAPLDPQAAARLLTLSDLIGRRIKGERVDPKKAREVADPECAKWLRRTSDLRRLFPQTLLQWILTEAGIKAWDDDSARGQTAMFHVGQLSTLIRGMETPGWTPSSEFRYQVIALVNQSAKTARAEEAPLLVPPDAVSIMTIHAAKGLEFPVVFVADVNPMRFPSSYAKRKPELPFDGTILKTIDPAELADNDNYDDERRLMYVALTRAERFAFVSASGKKTSLFFKEIGPMVASSGGVDDPVPGKTPASITYEESRTRRDFRLVTSFSDLRYYLECPHDFYLRKVLGFSPTIDQAFGYGKGIHNLLRAVHSDPARWAALGTKPEELSDAVDALIGKGLMYLRHTTGEPADNMKKRAKEIVTEYVSAYATELSTLVFEPEKPFETLIAEEEVLVSGAMDLIRHDDPPQVTIIDFKSGEPESEGKALDEEEMRLQVSLYGDAAKRELEYEPEEGLVRYLGDRDDAGKPVIKELEVPLDDPALAAARATVAAAARSIRERRFRGGPVKEAERCARCDFGTICGVRKNGHR